MTNLMTKNGLNYVVVLVVSTEINIICQLKAVIKLVSDLLSKFAVYFRITHIKAIYYKFHLQFLGVMRRSTVSR